MQWLAVLGNIFALVFKTRLAAWKNWMAHTSCTLINHKGYVLQKNTHIYIYIYRVLARQCISVFKTGKGLYL